MGGTMAGSDRPGGMDNLSMRSTAPKMKTKMPANEMPAVVKVAGGPVETSSKGGAKMKTLQKGS